MNVIRRQSYLTCQKNLFFKGQLSFTEFKCHTIKILPSVSPIYSLLRDFRQNVRCSSNSRAALSELWSWKWFQEYVHRVENKQFISKSGMSDSIYPPANYNKYFCQLFFLHDDLWNVNCRCYELFTNYFQWTVPKPRGKKNDVQFLQWSEGSSEHRAASVCFCFISISPASHLQIKEKIFWIFINVFCSFVGHYHNFQHSSLG